MTSVIQRREIATLLAMVGVAAFVALVYADTFVSLAGGWAYQDYSHGMLVFPISAYLLWRLRSPLASLDLRPWPWGLAVIAVLVMLWLLSTVVSVQAGAYLAAVLLIPAAIATCLGLPVTRRALFPLLFIVAAVPIGDALIPYLMEVTADVSAWLLRVVGVPVYRDGQFMSLPGGEFEVAEVCSGLRSLVAGTTMALLFAYLNFRSNAKRALFVAIAAVSLIAVNGLRAFIVMYVASATNLQLLGGTDHIYFGWVLFGILIGVLFWYGTRFSDVVDEAPKPSVARPDTRGPSALPLALVLGLVMLAITAQPFRRDVGNVWWVLPAGAVLLWALTRYVSWPATRATAGAARSDTRVRFEASRAVVVAAAVAVLSGGPLALSRAANGDVGTERTFALPAAEDCGPSGTWLGGWRPVWPSPDFGAVGSYLCSGEPVNVFVAGYRGGAQGRELVGEQNRLFPDDWRRFMVQDASRFAAAGGSTAVRELRVEGGGQRSLIWYWYAIGERTATEPVAVKLSQALELLTSGRADGAVFWLETPLTSGVEASRARLASVARDVASAFAAGSSAGHP